MHYLEVRLLQHMSIALIMHKSGNDHFATRIPATSSDCSMDAAHMSALLVSDIAAGTGRVEESTAPSVQVVSCGAGM